MSYLLNVNLSNQEIYKKKIRLLFFLLEEYHNFEENFFTGMFFLSYVAFVKCQVCSDVNVFFF